MGRSSVTRDLEPLLEEFSFDAKLVLFAGLPKRIVGGNARVVGRGEAGQAAAPRDREWLDRTEGQLHLATIDLTRRVHVVRSWNRVYRA